MCWLRLALLSVCACLAACEADAPTAIVLSIDAPGDEPQPPTGRFRPPALEARQAAIGSREGLSPQLSRAFDETVGFVPIAPPGPDDWLATHREPGQSFEGFLRSGANAPDEQRTTLYLMPIGAWASDFVVGDDGAVLVPAPPLSQLEEFARRYFQMPVKVLPGVAVETLQVTSRDHFGRRQLLTTDVLSALSRRLPEDAYCLIAVTMEDLYPAPAWNYVFGYASLKERVGVYSFARYDPAFYGQGRDETTHRRILRRGLKVMAHEIGHMYGIEHCVHYSCVMNGSNHLEESDTKPLHLCPVCLRKLHHSVGFDPATRYRELGQLYERVGLSFDAAWADRRRQFVESGTLGTTQASPDQSPKSGRSGS